MDPADIIQCPTEEGRSYSLKTIHGGVYARNRRFIKPDNSEAVTAMLNPPADHRDARPRKAIKKPDRLIESK